MPSLTVSYTGFVNSDSATNLATSPTIVTSATAASHVSGNPYSITPSAAVDADYTFTYVPGTLTVTAAPLTITANNRTNVYGNALPTLTASYVGFVNSDTSANLTTQPTVTTTATAGSTVSGSPYAITASGAVDLDYSISYVAGSLTVTQATPTVTWANPAEILYGTALGGTQLDATASTAGSFAYTPAAGTVLLVGSNQALSVTFTPTDAVDYTGATGAAQINVQVATPTLTWVNPAPIIYGTVLGASQLDATTPVPGTFAYTPAAGSVLLVGNNQMLSVTFTPSDGLDYNSTTTTAQIDVVKATPTATWANPTDITYGTALSATQLDASSPVAGTFAYSPASGTVLSTGSGQTLSAVFTPDDFNDYRTTSVTRRLTSCRRR